MICTYFQALQPPVLALRDHLASSSKSLREGPVDSRCSLESRDGYLKTCYHVGNSCDADRSETRTESRNGPYTSCGGGDDGLNEGSNDHFFSFGE
jgi:hypothetical protein